jgi:hypothetical protein
MAAAHNAFSAGWYTVPGLVVTFLWLTIGVTVIFVVLDWWLRIAALIAATGVTIHLTRMKTQQTTFPKHADTTHSIGSLDEVN